MSSVVESQRSISKQNVGFHKHKHKQECKMNGLNVNAKTFNQIDHHNQDYNKKKNSVENETMSLRNEDNVGVQNEPEYKVCIH